MTNMTDENLMFAQFVEQGGFNERIYQKRSEYRQNKF